MTKYSADYETRSCADLRRYGSHRYACDPSAAILLLAIAKEDGPVLIWDRFATDKVNAPAMALIREVSADKDATISCHNANFEVAVTKYLWEKTFNCPPPDPGQWRCTAAKCRMAAIPASLEKAAEFLNLVTQKQKIGKSLIGVFCCPRKDGVFTEPTDDKVITVGGEKMTPARAWTLFREYAIMDVETERKLDERLAPIKLDGWLLESFKLDIRMNCEGIPINLAAVEKAEAIVDEFGNRVREKFNGLTGLNPGQNKKVLGWLRERGYPGANLQVGTVTETLDAVENEEVTMTPEGAEALTLYSKIGYAALAKLPMMRNAACPDGRVRGTFVWWGASRTGRDSAVLLQGQNMKRSTKESVQCYSLIQQGVDVDDLEVLFSSPMEVMAQTIRHYIDPGEGQTFLDGDFSSVEARTLPWLAGDTEVLEQFRQGADPYKIAAAGPLGIKPSEVTKDQRQLGKVVSLALQFAGGEGAMKMACKTYKVKMTRKEMFRIIKAWRKANSCITAFWATCQEAAEEAIKNPGTWVKAGPCRYGVTKSLGYRMLVAELPSKRRLCYPYPEIRPVYKIQVDRAISPFHEKIVEDEEPGPDGPVEDKVWIEVPAKAAAPIANGTVPGAMIHDAINHKGAVVTNVWPKGVWVTHVWVTSEISFFGQFKASQTWGRVRTTGGKLAQNLTQSVSADFLKLGVIEIEKMGYKPLMVVHDQVITANLPGNTLEGLREGMCKLPPWALDFPLGADVSVAPFYTKD